MRPGRGLARLTTNPAPVDDRCGAQIRSAAAPGRCRASAGACRGEISAGFRPGAGLEGPCLENEGVIRRFSPLLGANTSKNGRNCTYLGHFGGQYIDYGAGIPLPYPFAPLRAPNRTHPRPFAPLRPPPRPSAPFRAFPQPFARPRATATTTRARSRHTGGSRAQHRALP